MNKGLLDDNGSPMVKSGFDIMKRIRGDNQPTKDQIKALQNVIKNWRIRYEDLVKVLEKWHFASDIMRDVDYMFCKDITAKLQIIIDDSKKDKRFRGQTPWQGDTTLFDNQMGNPVKLERQPSTKLAKNCFEKCIECDGKGNGFTCGCGCHY